MSRVQLLAAILLCLLAAGVGLRSSTPVAQAQVPTDTPTPAPTSTFTPAPTATTIVFPTATPTPLPNQGPEIDVVCQDFSEPAVSCPTDQFGQISVQIVSSGDVPNAYTGFNIHLRWNPTVFSFVGANATGGLFDPSG